MALVAKRTLFHPKFDTLLTVLFFLLASVLTVKGEAAFFDDALYFSLTPANTLPQSPSSLLVQSPSYINVPAGASLTVYLMKGDKLISISKLSFGQALFNERLLPPVPIASFVPKGAQVNSGQPLPGANLSAGEADLKDVMAFPNLYSFLWILSKGVIGTPGRAIATGTPIGFVDLKLAAVSAATILGDQKPGSVLFYNRYTSSVSNPSTENTRVNITNTNVASSVFVRFFLVNGSTCGIDSLQLCLEPQQTFSFLMSDIDPGIKGYIVAVATNANGEPIQFNWLIGTALVKQSAPGIGGSFTAALNALAIAKRIDGIVPNVNGSAEMIFDDLNYDRLPGQIAFEGIPSQSNAGNTTVFSLYRPVQDLTGLTANTSLRLTASAKNSQDQIVTTNGNLSVACYNDFLVSALRLTPTSLAQLLPSGANGWFSITTTDLVPILGAQLNTGEFNSGSNARPLSFSAEYKIRVPVSPVTCQ